MKLELKSLRVNARASEETTAFTATLYADGRKVAEVCNRGNGGPNEYRPHDRELFAAVEAYAKAQPLEFEHLDQVVDKLIAEAQALARLRRMCRNQTLFRLDGDDRGNWRTLNAVGAEARAHLTKKYGGRVQCVANDDPAAALRYC